MTFNTDKIVVSGIGAVTPLGSDLKMIRDKLKYGISGITYIPFENFEKLSIRHAGIVQDNYFEDSHKWLNFKHRATRFALYAAEKAIADALYSGGYDSSRVGICIGSEPASVDLSKQLPLLNELADNNINLNAPLINKIKGKVGDLIDTGLFPHLILSKISLAHNLNGPAFIHLGTCSASAQAIGEAVKMLQNGDVDMMIAGGVSAKIDPFSVARLIRVGALAPTKSNPKSVSRPFDKNRCGFTMAEGGVLFVLERYKNARKRGVTPYAEIAGYGAALDGYSITDPHPESLGMVLSMNRALSDANINPNDIDYLNAHGTSTIKNDIHETKAIKSVFNEHAKDLDISSTKSMHGHLMSAAGSMEALVSILSIKHGFIPPTINYSEPDENCDLNYNANIFKEKKVNTVLSNSFGLGGQNCSLIIRGCE